MLAKAFEKIELLRRKTNLIIVVYAIYYNVISVMY